MSEGESWHLQPNSEVVYPNGSNRSDTSYFMQPRSGVNTQIFPTPR